MSCRPRCRVEVLGLIVALGGLFVFLSHRPLWHTDLWGHLAYGRWMWEHGALPATEPFMPLAREVPISTAVTDYVVRLTLATHPENQDPPDVVRRYVRYGVSPRGAQAIVLGSKIRALMEGRLNVAYDDVRAVAAPALRHRLILNFDAESSGVTADDVLRVSREKISSQNAAIVLVGKADDFQKAIEPLGDVRVIPAANLDLGSPTLGASR